MSANYFGQDLIQVGQVHQNGPLLTGQHPCGFSEPGPRKEDVLPFKRITATGSKPDLCRLLEQFPGLAFIERAIALPLAFTVEDDGLIPIDGYHGDLPLSAAVAAHVLW